MKKLPLFLLTVLWLISCGRKDKDLLPNDVFEVTTSGTSFDCKLPIISFHESDRERIERITDRTGLSFEAYNLDVTSFNTAGQNLRVRIRKPLDSELFACTRMGPNFPWITVIDAEIID